MNTRQEQYSSEVVADLQDRMLRARPLWGFSSGARVTLLNLSENATFLLSEASAGREWVVRVHRVGYSSPAEIRAELQWITALRQEAVIETAQPLAGVDGELIQLLPPGSEGSLRYAVGFERLPGDAPDATRDVRPLFEQLGMLTARLHAHARAWRAPPTFTRKRWDLQGMVGADAHWGPWRVARGLDAAGAAILQRALECIAARLQRFGSSAQRFGLVHADLRLANLLVQGERLRVIDFDDCGFSWYLYDFAAAVSFIEHEAFVPDLLQAWLTGYGRIARVSPVELAEIPSFVVLRRIILTAWLASHAELPLARQLGAAYTDGTVRIAQAFLNGDFLTRTGNG